MRRRISALLVLIIAFTFTLGDAVPLLAEGEAELPVEAVEVETAEADSIDAEGLSLDGEWTVEPVDAPEDVTPTADEVAAATAEYAVITAEGTDVYDAQGAVIARISAGSAVLLVEASDGMMTVAFNTDRGVITGRVDEGAARRMTGAEAAALQDAMAESETVVLYQDNLDRPLPFAGCTYPEASPETEAEADPEGADAEETEEPEESKETEEPKGETESDNAEADDEAEAKAIEAEADDEEVAVAFETQAPQEAPALFALESEEALVPVGDTYEIAALDANGGVIDSSVLTYETSDASVADVSDDGVVTAFQAGSADITVSYQDQVLTSAIKVPQEPEAIVLSASTGTLGVKETYGDLDVTMLPANSAASITWSTSNAKIATVDEDGTIVGVKTGSATITATTRNGKKAACKVTVRKAPSKVSVTKSVTLGEAQDARVKANLPSGSASAITWTTSDESVALVAMDGTVTGVSAGTATVTATTYNGKKGSCTVTVRPAPEEIILNRSEANLNVKGTMTLSAQLSPAKAMAVNSFASSDPAVATVNGSGKVTAKGLGTATITATTYNGKIAECEVHVYKAPTKVALNRTKATLGVGMTLDLDETVFAADANPDVKWSSSNPKIATVSDGTVTAMKAGTATITVKTSNGKNATCKVTVKGAPNSLTLNTGAITLGANGMTARLEARVPNGTIAGTIQYASSDESVATVDERGLVTAGQAGTATITATTYNGKTAECQVTVLPAPAHVALDASEITVGVGQQLSITASAQGPNGSETITTFTYFLDQDSNNGAISLNASTGAIKGLKPGTAVVNVRTHNGVTATPCVVTVLPAPTGIKLSAGSGTIGVGEAYTGLSYKLIAPAGCDDTMAGVTWSSSNSKIAKVDRDGVITGVKTGSATITAKTSNGKKATCKVTVRKAPSSLSLNLTSSRLSTGMTTMLKPSVPSGTASAVITCVSSDESVATVDERGLVTAGQAGTATITATTYNGKTAECQVTVLPAPAHVALDASEITVGVGQQLSITASAQGPNGSETITAFTYFLDQDSDNGAISLNASTGAIKGLKPGTAVVNVRTHNGVTATPCVVTVLPAPTGIKLSAGSGTIGVGEAYTGLSYKLIAPAGCDDTMAGVTWSSSNSKIAKVDRDGTITGVKAGSATITAKTSNGKKATCKVTVKAAPTKVTLSPASLNLSAGGMCYQLNYTVSGNIKRWVSFKSDDESVAYVDEDGLITTINPGKATITARTYNGLTAQCAVSVAEKPSRVYFADTNVELYVNETHTPEIQVFAASGSSTIADLSLDVDDARSTGSVSINAGAVTAKATGRVYLNATTHNGVTADKPCVITIIPAPTSIRLDTSAATIGAGENFPLQAMLDGDADFCDDVSWKSSNEKIASVDAKGNVSGIAAGSATITATTCNGLTASCKFTVKKAPTSIKISPANGSLAVGKSGRYSVTLSKDSGGSYTFKSSNESIATVSNTGKVTVKATGRVTITVRTYNGLEATATLACGVPNDMPVSLASYVSSYSSGMSNADKIEYVIYVAQSKIGCKYVSPSFGPNTFDCVGLTYYCYKQAKISTKDTPAGQANDSRYTKITNWQDLKRGDIVCFKSDTKSNVNHVGLYLGNGWFIHASSSAGKVVVSELKTSGNYYNRNFVCGRRILN